MTENNSALELKVDADQTLLEPDLHDAELKNVTVKKSIDSLEVTLEYSTYQNEIYIFILEGCIKLDISGIHKQNVINNILISSTEQILSDKKKLLKDFDAVDDEKFFCEWILNDKISRMEIFPSYGAAIKIYYKSIVLQRSDSSPD